MLEVKELTSHYGRIQALKGLDFSVRQGELVALVGYYTLVAMTLNSHHIALPDGAAPAFPWPQPEPA